MKTAAKTLDDVVLAAESGGQLWEYVRDHVIDEALEAAGNFEYLTDEETRRAVLDGATRCREEGDDLSTLSSYL